MALLLLMAVCNKADLFKESSRLFTITYLELKFSGAVYRPENKSLLTRHTLAEFMTFIHGSSTDPVVIAQVKKIAHNKKRVLVALDSSHSHDHVLKELTLYSPFVSKGSYIVVFDTFIEDMPPYSCPYRP
jgi:cephalosporin hydroxylase